MFGGSSFGGTSFGGASGSALGDIIYFIRHRFVAYIVQTYRRVTHL